MNVQTPATHQAFIDESSSPSRRVLLLAACVQTHKKWSAFSDDWDRVLHETPRIEAFHMREARGRQGNFKGWRPIEVDRKIIALCELILRYEIQTATCWVDEKIYKETVAVAGPLDFRDPYYLCFHVMVTMLARGQQVFGFDTPVDYVFDEKGDTGLEALLWYASMKETAPLEIRKRMGSSPVFRDDEQVLPLQAADIVAWRRRRLIESSKRDPELASTMRLDELNRLEIQISRRYLEAIASELARVPNVGLSKAYGKSVYQDMKSFARKEIRRNLAQANTKS